MLNEAEWSRCIVVLESVFCVQPETKHDLYFELLSDYNYRELKASIIRCAKELRAYPNIMDIIDRMPGRIDAKSQSKIAWMNVLKAATSSKSCDGDYMPASGWQPNGHTLTDVELAACGGLRGLRLIMEQSEIPSELSFRERDFCDHYAAVVAQSNVGQGRVMGTETKQLLGKD